ncbi:uncharacterized protein N7482_002539 [Penicillium canariense]|uniref:Uncharacterized protein n=1 Tax=Penicillium canariense TaxID=189055 RepID=A0A9W9IHR5_9EURO|nr:uncharacterized protein N7482_002539 [Penicillium canariense]KAJ5176662.1 hypothetical protein N7482_002539 [Penicillium canariense]
MTGPQTLLDSVDSSPRQWASRSLQTGLDAGLHPGSPPSSSWSRLVGLVSESWRFAIDGLFEKCWAPPGLNWPGSHREDEGSNAERQASHPFTQPTESVLFHFSGVRYRKWHLDAQHLNIPHVSTLPRAWLHRGHVNDAKGLSSPRSSSSMRPTYAHHLPAAPPLSSPVLPPTMPRSPYVGWSTALIHPRLDHAAHPPA